MAKTATNSQIKKQCRKPVYLNMEKDSDVIEFISGLRNFSDWVKNCARKEIIVKVEKEEKIDTQAISEIIERMLEIRLAGKVLVNNNPEEVIGESGDFNIDVLDSLDDYM